MTYRELIEKNIMEAEKEIPPSTKIEIIRDGVYYP
jgi:hypothetical protein